MCPFTLFEGRAIISFLLDRSHNKPSFSIMEGRIEDLLPPKSDKAVIRRMLAEYTQQVLLAQQRGDRQLALDIYYRVNAQPAYFTEKVFRADGYQLNGPLPEFSAFTLGYRGLQSFVIKPHPNDSHTIHKLAGRGRDGGTCVSVAF